MSKKINITFDLETLGNTSNAPIVQIGAVKFDDGGAILTDFVRNIKLSSLEKYDFHVDYKTLQWWFEQDDAAIKSVMCPSIKDGTIERITESYTTSDSVISIGLREALWNFIEWIGKPGDYVYWSHATFDPPILNNNLIQVGLNNPIPFKLHRDIRTLTHFADKMVIERKGIHHNALDDCIFQAEYISKGIQNIKNKKL